MGPEAEPGATTPAPGHATLLLAGARLADGRVVDVLLACDRIEAVGTAGSLRAAERIDLTGYLLLPAPAEPHAHLDEALTASAGPGAGTTGGPASGPGPGQPEPPRPATPPPPSASPAPPAPDDVRRRITEAALTHLGYGSTAIRTHVRVSEATGLTRLDAALQAARDLRGLMDLQITALPDRSTLTERDGRALLREAARAGAHALGGEIGHPGAQDDDLPALLELAHSCGLPLDLHTTGAALSASLSAEAPAGISALPPGSMLTVAGPLDAPAIASLIEVASDAPRLGVVLLPQGGCRVGPHGPDGFDPATARRLADSGLADSGLLGPGLVLAAGSGALRDTARPTGRPDPIEAAFLLSATANLPASMTYHAVSTAARNLLGLPTTTIEAGRPAELLALRGESLSAALSGGHSRVVVHAGRVVSRTSAVREYADTTTAAVPRQGRPLGPA